MNQAILGTTGSYERRNGTALLGRNEMEVIVEDGLAWVGAFSDRTGREVNLGEWRRHPTARRFPTHDIQPRQFCPQLLDSAAADASGDHPSAKA